MVFLLRFFTILSTITVSWFNTNVDVPVDSDLEQYLKIPYATIVIDGDMKDTTVSYQTNGVKFTFESTINTGIVKTYTLYYQAYFDVYDVYSKQAITFRVYDDIAPNVLNIPDFNMSIDDKPPDLYVGLVYEDNYDDVSEITVMINDDAVNYEMLGCYPIIYTVIDSSYNQRVVESEITIVDKQSPVIEQKDSIIIECGEYVILDEYFKVTDNYDQSLVIDIDDTTVMQDIVGSYELTVYVSDQSGNRSQLTTTVFVVDTTPPVIRLMSHPPPITVFDTTVFDMLDAYVIDIQDQGTILNEANLVITHDIQIDRIGTYDINYQVTDTYGNKTIQSLQVQVIDDVPPTIILNEALVFPVYGPDQFLNTYFDIFDNYDTTASLNIDIDASPNYDVIGRYQIVVTAEDASDQIARYEGYIDIVDTISPSITQLNDIVITDFLPHVLSSYFMCKDNYSESENLLLMIDDQHVDYESIGIYTVHVQLSDESFNTVDMMCDIFVVDVIPPTLLLQHDSLTCAIQDDPINFRALIKSAIDNYDSLTIDDVVIEETVNMMTVGVYQVNYQLTDQSGNQTSACLTLTVDDFEAPVIDVSHQTITQYDTIDLLADVHVTDEGSTVEVMCYPAQIDTSSPGEHIVSYIAQDARGNYAIAYRTITILPTEASFDIDAFIPMIGSVVIGTILIIVIKKRG